MSSDLRTQVFNTLSLRETDDLVEIWITNDRVEWSDTAFEVIQEILKTRLGELPPQNEPILEHFDPDSKEDYDEITISEKFKDPQRTPIFYNPKRVLEITKGMNRMSFIAVVITFFTIIPLFIRMQEIIRSLFPAGSGWDSLAIQLGCIASGPLIVLECSIIYFSFRGLSSLLRILMEMEFSSRISANVNNNDEPIP
jgi:hypothetical protein